LTTVQTTAGTLKGLDVGGVSIFRGVPYTRPPVGELRLRAPRHPEPWAGTLDAAEFGARPPQNPPGSQFWGTTVSPQDEDCLTLNIWTPAADGAGRPVLVWIHGGAYVIGSGASPLYDGTRLALRGDVVIVTINYRLGILGYLAHPELADAEAGGACGNWGLLDAVAALRWVRDNIAAFGGDPGNVTIFGESAGGGSVGGLLAAPSAKGLFHKAIIQSGPPYAGSMREATETADTILAEMNLARVEQLRDVSVDAVLAAQSNVIGLRGSGRLPMLPVVDGVALPSPPMSAIAEGAAASVPLLIGTNRDELKVFMAADPASHNPDEEVVRSRLEQAFAVNQVEADASAMIEGYRQARSARGDSVEPRELWSAIETDRTFRNRSIRAAEEQSRHQPRTFMYLFTWESPAMDGALGASHAVELPFMFGNLAAPRMDSFAGSGAAAEELSEKMMDAWVAFARTGNPSGGGLGEWPAYEPSRRATMILDQETRVEDAPYDAERRLWEGALANMVKEGVK
jgi:para-nitrobenzyl esterase